MKKSYYGQKSVKLQKSSIKERTGLTTNVSTYCLRKTGYWQFWVLWTNTHWCHVLYYNLSLLGFTKWHTRLNNKSEGLFTGIVADILLLTLNFPISYLFVPIANDTFIYLKNGQNQRKHRLHGEAAVLFIGTVMDDATILKRKSFATF